MPLSESARKLYAVTKFISFVLAKDAIVMKSREDAAIDRVRERIDKMNAETLILLTALIDETDFGNDTKVRRAAARARRIIKEHGATIAPVVAKEFHDIVRELYDTYREEEAQAFAYDAAEDDDEAILIAIRLTALQDKFITEHYDERVSDALSKRFLAVAGIEGVDEAERQLRDALPYFVEQEPYFRVTAGQCVGAVAAYAALKVFEEVGVMRYRVVATLDNRTSQICRFMHNKILEVRKGIDWFSRYDTARTPADLRAGSTWLSYRDGNVLFGDRILTPGMSGIELQALGVNAPPYHPNCRSVVVAVVETDAFLSRGDGQATPQTPKRNA